MKRGLLLLAIILTSAFPAMAASYNELQDISVDIFISTSARIIPKGTDWRIDNMQARLLYFPKETSNMRVRSFSAQPDYEKNDTAITFEWNDLKEKEISIHISAALDNSFHRPEVRQKITFPILSVPDEVKKYTEPGKKINSDNTIIIAKASELGQGSDDLYEVVFRVGDWVERNINYNLTSATIKASQPASWVLQNRYGVCDEITTLFVAMLRSMGIPARFVSGLAYTDYQGLNDFGPHAWAEVYFPGYGWVPFDLTYGQFGMVDATHLPLAFTTDAGESSIKYRWTGWQVDVETEQLKMDAKIIETGEKIPTLVQMELTPWRDKVGFGSYTLIEAELHNPHDAYLPLVLRLATSRGIETNSRKQILLKPREKRTIYWKLKLDDDLDRDYIYTFTAEMYNNFNQSVTAKFESTFDSPYFTEKDVMDYIELNQEEQQKVYSKKVELSCRPEREEYYKGEEPKIICSARNIGTVNLEDTEICLDECYPLDLAVGQSQDVTLPFSDLKAGRKDVTASLKGGQVSKSSNVEFVIWDDPKIEITNITKPESVRFDDTFQLEFTLDRTSMQIPKNLRIVLKQGRYEKEWNLPELVDDKALYITMEGSSLEKGDNTFEMIVDYEDGQGKKYNQRGEATLVLENVTFIQQLVIWINSLGRTLSSFDLKVLILVAFIIGTVAGIFIVRGHEKKLPIDSEIKRLREKEKETEKELKGLKKGGRNA
ncbi:MAG: transglutaminase-like domain-containing protein [Nanoarchaeota archaeon]|nr:transglutaminase-like domain-containing protein [Nanoarchaeota archaeon]